VIERYLDGRSETIIKPALEPLLVSKTGGTDQGGGVVMRLYQDACGALYLYYNALAPGRARTDNALVPGCVRYPVAFRAVFIGR